MAFNITPSLGMDFDRVDTTPAFRVGNKVVGNDGHSYVYVLASGAIAAAAAPGTQVAITEPAFTAATGAGGWYAPVAGVASGSYAWVRNGTLT